jgi:hypothetical protein
VEVRRLEEVLGRLGNTSNSVPTLAQIWPSLPAMAPSLRFLARSCWEM